MNIGHIKYDKSKTKKSLNYYWPNTGLCYLTYFFASDAEPIAKYFFMALKGH